MWRWGLKHRASVTGKPSIPVNIFIIYQRLTEFLSPLLPSAVLIEPCRLSQHPKCLILILSLYSLFEKSLNYWLTNPLESDQRQLSYKGGGL
jgi:hypothetical protein